MELPSECMAEPERREPEQSDVRDISCVLRDYEDPSECVECFGSDGSHIPVSFSFDDGIQLQEKVTKLERELENLASRVGSMTIRNNEEANEETRARQIEERQVGHLIAEIDAMKKELAIRKDNEDYLREQLHRAVTNARLEREALERQYEEEFLALKRKYEGDSNKAPFSLITELESQINTYKDGSGPSQNTREVQFTVTLVPNNDLASTGSSQPCSHLSCYSCKEAYLPESGEGVCFFHPLPPMTRNKWEKYWGLDEVDSKKYQSYCYWACCNTLARKRPVGCCRGRHHQKWESDILLKQAMQEDHWNIQNMLERSKSQVKIITE